MSDKQQLSSIQILLLILFCNISTTVFFVPGEITAIVNQDAWMSIILGTILAALLVYYPLAVLGIKYPTKNIIEYSQVILGRYLGKLVAFLFLYYFFQLHCWTLSEYGQMSVSILSNNPLSSFTITMSILTIFAVYKGIEVIGRCGEFVFPIGLLFLFLVIMSSLPDVNVQEFFPVKEADYSKILFASISPLDWLSLGFVFSVITPLARNHQKLKIVAIIGILLSGTILLVTTVSNIGVFGSNQLNHTNFPFLQLVRYSEILGFERAESVVVMYWITWVFIRAALYSYATVYSLKIIFNLSDYRIYIVPETILAVAYSSFQYRNFIEQSYLFASAHFFYLSFSLLLPFGLWAVDKIKPSRI